MTEKIKRGGGGFSISVRGRASGSEVGGRGERGVGIGDAVLRVCEREVATLRVVACAEF